MNKRPPLSPTLEELMRRGDEGMAAARQAIANTRQIVEESRKLYQEIADQG